MGVPGLWKLLKPSAQDGSLMELTLREGFIKNNRGDHTIIYGIDASIWMYETQAVFYKPTHLQAGRNPELKTLFFKLAQMLNSCAVPIFVFDGPDRPLVKRDHEVRVMPPWLKMDFERLIDAFGFFSHQAPGEAEAELAYLNSVGTIDAVLTEDVDAFVFGAKTVVRTRAMRTSTGRKKGTEFMTYSLGSLTADPGDDLSREDMFLIAVLSGGDYDGGLTGCGMTLARRIAQCGLGYDLFEEMCRSAHRNDVHLFLQHWRMRLRHVLLTDPNNILGRKYRKLANSINEDFPSWKVMNNYVHPITSERTNGTHGMSAGWVPRFPSIEKMTRLCEQFFTWGTVPGIIDHFAAVVWPGACVRTLLQPPDLFAALEAHFNNTSSENSTPPLSAFLSICHSSHARKNGEHLGTCHLHVKTNTHTLAQTVASNVIGLCPNPPSSHTLSTEIVRIPDILLRHALPGMVQIYDARRGASSTLGPRQRWRRQQQLQAQQELEQTSTPLSHQPRLSTHSHHTHDPDLELEGKMQVYGYIDLTAGNDSD